MTQDQFYTWLNDPSTMDAESIPQLREIVKRYPYFNLAQMMLAKNLKSENHIDQLRQLQLAAVLVPDRGVFQDYLKDKKKVHSIAVEEKTVVEKVENNEAQTLEEEEKLPEGRFPDELIPEPVVYQLETADLPELPPKTERPKEPEELSFSEWLVFAEQKKVEVDNNRNEVLVSTETPNTELSGIDLIDHFLTQASDKPQRAEFFNPRKAAAKADQDDFSVVSETLANIYFEQEKYELAKQAYEALSLKYPEKSVYFAARLKETNDKLISE